MRMMAHNLLCARSEAGFCLESVVYQRVFVVVQVISFDVKPANVLLDRSMKHAKLADVGLAKVLERSMTMTVMVCMFGSQSSNASCHDIIAPNRT